MFQYKAVLKSSKEVVCQGHSIVDVEHQIKHYKRQQKKGEHTHSNDVIQIIHVLRDGVQGKSHSQEEVIKEV